MPAGTAPIRRAVLSVIPARAHRRAGHPARRNPRQQAVRIRQLSPGGDRENDRIDVTAAAPVPAFRTVSALSFLAPLFNRRDPWATVYVAPAQNDESAKRRELSVRETCRNLEEEGAAAVTVQAVREVLMNIGPAEDPAG